MIDLIKPDDLIEKPRERLTFKRLVTNKDGCYSIIYEDENGVEHEGSSSYSLWTISNYLKQHFFQDYNKTDDAADDILEPWTKKVLCNKFLSSMKEEVETKKSQNWIPCSERLPDTKYWGESRNVLASCKLHQHRFIKVLYFDGSNWCKPNGDIVYYWDVTAWMPLPDAYEEG